MRNRTQAIITAVLVLALLVGAWFLLNRPTASPAGPGSAQTSTVRTSTAMGPATSQKATTTTAKSGQTTTARPGPGTTPAGTDAASGLRTVRLDQLPKEAADTMRAIKKGPPFPFGKDGTVFGNFEGRLPKKASGYYHEFTVVTPGENDRGARRIIAGGPNNGQANGEYYYTGDHYGTFERITS